jgi:hypothetical protein
MSRAPKAPTAAKPVAFAQEVKSAVVRGHSLTDVQQLASLIRRYSDRLPLPDHVIERDGRKTPVAAWLDGLRFDRTTISTDLASRLALQSDPPSVCEAALTLRGRMIDDAADRAGAV